MTRPDDVLWHDIECGGYDVDLPLWRELAAREGAPVLDVGAGTGRVALDLARRGHEVVALDLERGAPRRPARARRAACRSRPCAADARDFALGRALRDRRRADADGAAPRRPRRAARASSPAHASTWPPAGCSRSRWPTRWRPSTPSTTSRRRPTCARSTASSTPAARSAVRDLGDRAAIERVREIVARDGTRTVSDDVDRARPRRRPTSSRPRRPRFGLRAEPPRRIPPDARVRGLDGGDAPWLSARCASARCTPTS